MKRELCCECGKKKEETAPFMRLLNGELLRVCRACLTSVDYVRFLMPFKTPGLGK